MGEVREMRLTEVMRSAVATRPWLQVNAPSSRDGAGPGSRKTRRLLREDETEARSRSVIDFSRSPTRRGSWLPYPLKRTLASSQRLSSKSRT